MFTHVNHVLTGTQYVPSPASLDALTVGQVVLLNENGALTTDANRATAQMLQIAVVKEIITIPNPEDPSTTVQRPIFEVGMPIQPNLTGTMTLTYSAYIEPSLQVSTIDFSAASPVPTVGRAYTLRILYKDLSQESMSGQFTHTYQVIANTATWESVAAQFVVAINSDPKSRVSSSLTGTTITLTAKAVADNSIDESSVVSFVVSVFQEIVNNALTYEFTAIPGVVIETTTEPFKGLGTWQTVRDLERRNMGYKGHIFEGGYPTVEGKFNYKQGTLYQTLTIEYDNLFRSNDNQYIKDTPLVSNVFLEDTTGNVSALAEALSTWSGVPAVEFTTV